MWHCWVPSCPPSPPSSPLLNPQRWGGRGPPLSTQVPQGSRGAFSLAIALAPARAAGDRVAGARPLCPPGRLWTTRAASLLQRMEQGCRGWGWALTPLPGCLGQGLLAGPRAHRGAAPGPLCYPGSEAGWAPQAPHGLCSQLWVTGHPPVCPGQGYMVPAEDPACSQDQLVGCVPLIPVPIQSTRCLGDICSIIPTKGDWGMPSLAHVHCMLGEGRSNGKQGQPEPGMRGMSRAAWGVRAGQGG